MKKLVFTLITVFLLFAVTEGQNSRKEKRKAREKANTEQLKQLIDNRNFEFFAQSANPMGGSVIHLTSPYTLDIRNDSVRAFLPYYGVAYYAEYGGGEGGIKFEEKAESSEWKISKNGYDIAFKIKTTKDLYNLHLYISKDGYGNLQVSCINRQPISFYGYVQAIPTK
jgi:hypothetical protein